MKHENARPKEKEEQNILSCYFHNKGEEFLSQNARQNDMSKEWQTASTLAPFQHNRHNRADHSLFRHI